MTQASFSPFLTTLLWVLQWSSTILFSFFAGTVQLLSNPLPSKIEVKVLSRILKLSFLLLTFLAFLFQNFNTMLFFGIGLQRYHLLLFFCRRSLSHLYKNILLIEVCFFLEFPHQLFLDQECPQCFWHTYTC